MVEHVIAWVLAVVLPSAHGLPGLDTLDARPSLRHILSRAPLAFRLGVYGATLVFLCTPVLTLGWPLPAFLLSGRQRDAHADRLAGHRLYLLRQSMLMLKTVAGLVWGGRDEVRSALGLPPQPADPGTRVQASSAVPPATSPGSNALVDPAPGPGGGEP